MRVVQSRGESGLGAGWRDFEDGARVIVRCVKVACLIEGHVNRSTQAACKRRPHPGLGELIDCSVIKIGVVELAGRGLAFRR